MEAKKRGLRKIVVIDDDKPTRLLIAQLLTSKGYQTITARNGIEGIRLALSSHPDLLTVDLMMPHLNGPNLMKILTALQLEIPCIFVTANEQAIHYKESFPYVKHICSKSEIQTKLTAIIDETIAQPNRGYTDITYSLDKDEILGLLAKSDRKKILVVSSPETIEHTIRLIGETDIYELYRAPDGQEAVYKAVMIQPDLIICDTELPNINGINLAKILYILGHPFPIVYLSEKADIETIQKAAALEGIKGYLLRRDLQANNSLLLERMEQILGVSAEEKDKLRAFYQEADVGKIGEFDAGSSIWASLSP